MNTPIVYAYPGCNWDTTPGRQRYIMEAMSEHTHVVFLNGGPARRNLVNLSRPRVERRSRQLTLIHDAFAFQSSRVGRRLGNPAALIDSVRIHSLLRGLGIREYIYWLSAPEPRLLTGMQTNRLVFDCIDPCFNPKAQSEFDKTEAAIARRSRIVLCTAEVLLEKMQLLNPRSYLVPNACSPEEYHPDVLQSLPRPAPLVGRPAPVIGYMGTFDWRVDAEVLTAAARRLPAFTFALVGRVNGDQRANFAELSSLPNVVMPGAVSAQEGRAYTAAFDVGLIPFRPNAMNDAINPVKMYMYLMAGIPTVSTWIHEGRRHAPYVTAAEDLEGFVHAIPQVLADNTQEQVAARIEFALKNTWRHRAASAITHLEAAGLWQDSPYRRVA